MCGYTDRTRTRTVKRLFSLTFTLSGVVLLLIILGGKIDDTALAGSPPQVSPPDQLTFSPVDVDTDATLAATTAITGSKPWIWILCKFSDIATEPQNLTYFQNLHASLDTYFRAIYYP
jgi:hypothetical protein